MRPATDAERDFVATALERFGPDLLESWLREAQLELWVHDATPRRFYAVAASLGRPLRTAAGDLEPEAAGLEIGSEGRGGLELGLEGAYEVARRAQRGRLRIRDKAEQLFLYGRDVLGVGVARVDPDLHVGDVALVINSQGEGLGTGRLLQRPPAKGRVLIPLLDRGWYLRRGG